MQLWERYLGLMPYVLAGGKTINITNKHIIRRINVLDNNEMEKEEKSWGLSFK